VKCIFADAALSGSGVTRDVLSLHLARFFAAAAGGPAANGAAAGCAMTPHSAGPRAASDLPPFVAPDEDGGADDMARAGSNGAAHGDPLAVPDHMHGEMVRALGLALLAELGHDGPVSPQSAATLAEAIAARLAAAIGAVGEGARPVARGGLAPHILRRVTDRMASDLAEELDLPTLAAEARLSPWHFARAFKQSTGEPPHAYRTRLRIEHAKAMLAETDEPVTAIAEAVGYDSAQSLARAFRKLTGISPSAFRRVAAV
jgi:AraC family transcriptional regulator